MGFKV